MTTTLPRVTAVAEGELIPSDFVNGAAFRTWERRLMYKYEPGDKVRTICDIATSAAYTSVKGVRLFASGDAQVKCIPKGTEGVVVEQIVDLIVSFGEPGIAGRAIHPSMLEPIEKS